MKSRFTAWMNVTLIAVVVVLMTLELLHRTDFWAYRLSAIPVALRHRRRQSAGTETRQIWPKLSFPFDARVGLPN